MGLLYHQTYVVEDLQILNFDQLDSCLLFSGANGTRWTPGKGLDIFFPREARFGHIAWTPPSLPHSVVLIGGSLKNAEVVPGGISLTPSTLLWT